MNKILIIALLFVVGCSKEKEFSFENQLSGHYKIVSIHSTSSIDMNNDGLKSNDLIAEISGSFAIYNGEKVFYYNFDSPSHYMEVRPLKNTTNNAQLIAINFPEQYIDQLQNGEFYLMHYQNSFINYSYKFIKKSNQIELIDNNPDFDEKGKIKTLEMKPNGQLELKLTKQLFDFSTKEWRNTDITTFYEKTEWP